MTKEYFVELLRHPEKIAEAADDLGVLVGQFPYFHTGYMLYIKGLQQTDGKKMEQQLGTVAINVRDRVLLYDYLHAPEIFHQKIFPKKNAKRETSPEALIDAFILSNPKIAPSETVHEVDLSDSMQDIIDIGTESLADIYANQGEKNKAIEIYERLILKYPEKNIYFAAQIKRLKNK